MSIRSDGSTAAKPLSRPGPSAAVASNTSKSSTSKKPQPPITDPKLARLMFGQRSRNVVHAYTVLNKIVERHEATIQKRWLSKTRKARIKILLNAWPDMPLLHRPDFKALRLLEGDQIDAWQRGALLWPHINQEDLAKPRTFLLLLNSRGRNLPKEFVVTDHKTIAAGFDFTRVGSEFDLGGSYMPNMHAATLHEYGTLKQLSDRTCYAWLPTLAFLLLETQERLLKFLVSVCRMVLHDIAPGPMITDNTAYPVQTEPRLTTETGTSPFVSLAATVFEASYRVPATTFEFHDLASLLNGLSEAARAHVVALREDPGYFGATVQELCDHNALHIKLENGKDNPGLKAFNNSKLHMAALRGVVGSSYTTFEMYSRLVAQAFCLRNAYRRHISTEGEGPGQEKDEIQREYLYELSRMRYLLYLAERACIGDLRNYFLSSPPMRGVVRAVRDQSKEGGQLLVLHNPDPVQNDDESSGHARLVGVLTWPLMTLVNDDKIVSRVGIAQLVDEIQRSMDHEKLGGELFTPFIASIVGRLSVLVTCARIVGRVSPLQMHIPEDILEKARRDINADLGSVSLMAEATRSCTVHSAPALINPSNGRFAYPVDKRRTKETAEAMRRAEQNLDEFWVYVDKIMCRKTGNLKLTMLQSILKETDQMRRTRKWVEPHSAASIAGDNTDTKTDGGEKNGKKKGGNKAAANTATATATPAADAVIGTNYLEPDLLPLSPHMYNLLKNKTSLIDEHPELIEGVDEEIASSSGASSSGSLYESDELPDTQDTTIKVDARALKVFRGIFFDPNVHSTFGEIPWNDFVSAMCSIGFRADKLYGSQWHFRPTKRGIVGVPGLMNHAIQLTDPFPQTKLSFDRARWLGHRLWRKYEWHRGTFVAKSK